MKFPTKLAIVHVLRPSIGRVIPIWNGPVNSETPGIWCFNVYLLSRTLNHIIMCPFPRCQRQQQVPLTTAGPFIKCSSANSSCQNLFDKHRSHLTTTKLLKKTIFFRLTTSNFIIILQLIPDRHHSEDFRWTRPIIFVMCLPNSTWITQT